MQLGLPLDAAGEAPPVAAGPPGPAPSVPRGIPAPPMRPAGNAPPPTAHRPIRSARSETPTAGRASPPADAVHFVRHARARRYVLRVEHDGRVRVTIPRGGSKREAAAFAARQGHWIAAQRARLATTPAIAADVQREARRRARHELPPRLLALAAQYRLEVARVSVRNQRTRWGSCGRDGHISLNWRLVLMPEWVRDYVLVHELMHLRRLDHSPAYWRLVAAACPRYREARQWLRLNGPSLR